VWRAYGADGHMAGDILSVEADKQDGEPLIVPVMRAGKRVAPSPTLVQIRERAVRELAGLPEPLRKLEPGDYPVTVADALKALATKADARTRN
jgi:nicotinate phosphoribosyltransferase